MVGRVDRILRTRSSLSRGSFVISTPGGVPSESPIGLRCAVSFRFCFKSANDVADMIILVGNRMSLSPRCCEIKEAQGYESCSCAGITIGRRGTKYSGVVSHRSIAITRADMCHTILASDFSPRERNDTGGPASSSGMK